jgi:hypothetical protein
MANTFSTGSFRIVGRAATTQNLFTIENTSTTTVLTLRRLIMQMDATVTLQAVMPLVKTSRCAVPTGGFTPTTGVLFGKVPFDTTTTSATTTTIRLDSYVDGTNATTAITATPAYTLWQQFGMRISTAVGQIVAVDCDMLPMLVSDSSLAPFTLRANEALVVQIVAAATTSNPTTNHYFVNCVWEEA